MIVCLFRVFLGDCGVFQVLRFCCLGFRVLRLVTFGGLLWCCDDCFGWCSGLVASFLTAVVLGWFDMIWNSCRTIVLGCCGGLVVVF